MSEPRGCDIVHAASISEMTTFRWGLEEECERYAAHRFPALALWRTKISDVGPETARRLLLRHGLRASSLQWAGGFTGSDGLNFRESVDDAVEAIEAAAFLGAGVLVVHPGCRGGHTVGHAHRLLAEACEVLAPRAWDVGVRLAIRPFHAAASAGCGLLTRLSSTLEWIERFDHPAVGMALDLWHFGHDATVVGLLPALVRRLAVVKVADRVGPPVVDGERLLPGRGTLPLESLVAGLVAHGYRGDVEFEAVGEEVEAAGYEATLGQLRGVADAWARHIAQTHARDRARITSPAAG
jgi:sugar phosphate isomerase/epimerase